jgi:hypothetical protein
MTEVFMVFLIPSRKILIQYLILGHDCLFHVLVAAWMAVCFRIKID